jgi:hypothetical protein
LLWLFACSAGKTTVGSVGGGEGAPQGMLTGAGDSCGNGVCERQALSENGSNCPSDCCDADTSCA